MRELDNIGIDKTILHLVAPNKRGVLRLSPHVFETSNETVLDFLVGHIRRGLGSGRSAWFKKAQPGGNHVAGWCAQAAKGREATFVDRSRLLAEAMYAEMAKNKIIPDAVFAVIAYRASESAGEAGRYLALLKLDPGLGFVPEELADGTIAIGVAEDVLPSTREGLQKCAFVTPDFGQERQLVVLDVQAGTGHPRLWFLESFLEAGLGNEAELTRDLSAALHEARGRLEPLFDNDQRMRFEARVRGMWAGETADAEGLVRELELPEEQAQILLDTIDRRVEDRSFPIDRVTANRYLRSVRYKADNSVEVKGPPNAFGTTVKVAPDEEDPAYKIVTIRTRKWELQ